jgi:high-affinity Fe2+/Pb2+ permease
LSATATHRFFQLSGVILIFIGAMMFNKGLIRTHSGYDFRSIEQQLITEWYQSTDTGDKKQKVTSGM